MKFLSIHHNMSLPRMFNSPDISETSELAVYNQNKDIATNCKMLRKKLNVFV
tara:strand:+ start:739 stop:894 length:156 start_codon:yes stop_codon:yes gene_type:complete